MKPKKKSIPTKRELFTAIGVIQEVEGRKRFVPLSPEHLNACVSRLSFGQKLTATFTETKYLRSRDQLKYHMVLVGYIAHDTGHTKNEIHDALMRIVFGTKTIHIGNKSVEVRQSMADDGGLMKFEVMELIEKDLEICGDLGIRVPSKEELGYLPG